VYYSRIERFRVTGGYLDEVDLELSGHLNALIGGRGTGKSTLIECIRYALGLEATGKNAQKQHQELIKENLGKSKARVELVVRSSQMNGKQFTIARRYGENPVVLDAEGNASSFKPLDILPSIKIYGQNEIYEIAQDKNSQRELLSKFLMLPEQDEQKHIEENKKLLTQNSRQLIQVLNEIAQVQDEVSRLPKLEEQLGHFKALGIEEKLKIIPLLEEEKLLKQTIADSLLPSLEKAFQSIEKHLPQEEFLSDETIGHLPHSEILRNIRTSIDGVRDEAMTLLARWAEKYAAANLSIKTIMEELSRAIQLEEESLETRFKELPSAEGKSGKEIGVEYQTLVRQIEQIRPKQTLIQDQTKAIEQLMKDRKTIQDRLSQLRSARAAKLLRQLKRLNKRLSGKIRLTLQPEADRTPVTKFIMSCKLEGIGEGRLAWIEEAEDFSVAKLAELIQAGSDALQSAGWGITAFIADSLRRLTPEQILQLEELELPDLFSIELNVAHEGPENYRPLNKLSTGQQCTAILHLLLLDDVDPLIMDQPEDNLDNAFIADRIVNELRSAKIARQFIFATHNANIPVFGDAEWIGVFEAQDGNARIPAESQGAIDVASVRDKAANILEGGRIAFNQRKLKYGF
jgi:DNA repair ATPase RecN